MLRVLGWTMSETGCSGAGLKNFIDAVVLGSKVNAPLSAGLDATLPVQMALHSYWSHKMTTAGEFV